jgi:hypothetical protein
MSMPTSANGGTWLSGDVIGKQAANLKSVLNIPSTTYVPVIGTDYLLAGTFYIDPVTGLRRLLNEAGTIWNVGPLTYLTHDPNGFPVNTSGNPNPSNQSTLAFTNASRTFTITPTGSSFSVYINGAEYTYTTAQTVVITNTEGLWYIIFHLGTLTASQTAFNFETDALVAVLYWDATDSLCSFFADERHMFTMDWRTHYYLHNSIGTRYVSGLAMSGYTIQTGTSGVTDAMSEVAFGNGTIFDEDLEVDIANGTSGTPASTPNFFNQPLTKPAQIPVFYQAGATGTWRKQTAGNFPYINGSSGRIYYNLNTSGTWSQADAGAGGYVSFWIFATNDIDNPIISIQGQQVNTSLANVDANDTYAALSLASGLPFPEMKLLYRIVTWTGLTITNTCHADVVQVDDFRTSSIGGTASNTSGFISSVGLGFLVSAGNLALNSALWSIDASGNLTLNGNCIVDNGGTPFTLTSSHLQNVGTGDGPTFTNVVLGTPTINLTEPTSGQFEVLFASTSVAEMFLESNHNIPLGYLMQRNAGGAYDVTWYNIVPASTTALQWNIGSSALMILDTSGNLTITGNFSAASTHWQNIGSGDSPTFAVITGSGWVNSAPSLIQVARAPGTVYQNATGKTKIVYISVQIAGNAVGETNYVSFQIGPTSPPPMSVAYASNSTVNQTIPFAMIVPNGYYYELINNGAALVAIVWTEQYL